MRILVVPLLIVVAAGAGCGGSAGLDKAGSRPVVLRLTVGDRSGASTDLIARAFARRVQSESDGRIRVKVEATDNASLPGDLPERVIRAVQSGKADMTAAAARGWAGVGVTSLQPLETPMLISSDQALDAVTKGPVADDMLGGIRATGLEPLGLIPDGLRLLLGFERPLASPAALQGATIRMLPTRPGYAALEALGAHPRWIPGFHAQDLAFSGKITGAVTSPESIAQIAPGTYTANVPIYANAITLAISGTAWKRLDGGQRRVLTDAAGAVRDAWARTRATLASSASDACDAGFGVALADAQALAAFRRAFAPVVASIEAEAGNRSRIARIRETDASSPKPALTRCAAASVKAPVPAGRDDQTVLDGTWRKLVTKEQWAKAGLPPLDWNTNGGLQTTIFGHGTWFNHDDVVGKPPDSGGPMSIRGDVVTLVLSTLGKKQIKPFTLLRARFVRDGATLRLTIIDGKDPILAVVFGGVWKQAG